MSADAVVLPRGARILAFLFVAVFSLFLAVAPYGKLYVKTSFYAGLALFLLIIPFVRSLPGFRKDVFLAMPLLCFLALSLLSLFYSDFPKDGMTIFYERYLAYCAMFIMGAFATSCLGPYRLFGTAERRGVRVDEIFSAAFCLSALIFSSGALIDYVRLRPDRLCTVFGYFIDFFMFPMYLVFFMPVLFSFALFSRSKLLANAARFALALFIPCLIFSGSRAGWITVPLGCTWIILRKNKRLIKFMMLFVAVFIVLLFLIEPLRLKQFDSLAPRKDLWDASARILKGHPVLGAGPGAYERMVADYSTGYVGLHAHNIYMEVVAEMGLLGLIAFLGIFIVFFRKASRVPLSGDDSLRIGIEGMVLATLLFAFSGSVILVGFRDAPLFWFLFGLGSGIVQSEN